ncbi:MAG TPA: FtsX-like permease family protein [Gemmatimonadaceae bacterium]|nr:FtsX-like permease family protein [Gemmatimonadaceae bacterium]
MNLAGAVAALLVTLATVGALPRALRSQQPSPAATPATPAPRAARAARTIAIDERLAADAGLRVGDRVVLSATPAGGGADTLADTAVVAAITKRGADPSEVARDEYLVRLHLDQLQSLVGYGDRVDRFAVATRGGAARDAALRQVNAAAFGFRAYPSREIAVETSRTFQVVSRFHRAIGVITIVASAIFLLCILLLKVEERRRDVAALRLMGVSRVSVLRSVVLEAAMVALLGSALGTFIGWLATVFINWHYRGVYRTPLTFALVTPGIVAFSVALSLGLGVAAGLAAATRLVRTPPLALFGR